MRLIRYVMKPKSPKLKGYIGEAVVKAYLRNYPFKIRNLIIGNKNKAQIDNLLVCDKGIIVIETKNYSGLIVGNEKDELWNQYLSHKRIQFKSPIKQNEYHINVLNEVFPKYKGLFVSIVVFTGKSKLKVNSQTNVIKVEKLLKTIKSLESKKINEELQKEIYKVLKDYNLSNK